MSPSLRCGDAAWLATDGLANERPRRSLDRRGHISRRVHVDWRRTQPLGTRLRPDDLIVDDVVDQIAESIWKILKLSGLRKLPEHRAADVDVFAAIKRDGQLVLAGCADRPLCAPRTSTMIVTKVRKEGEARDRFGEIVRSPCQSVGPNVEWIPLSIQWRGPYLSDLRSRDQSRVLCRCWLLSVQNFFQFPSFHFG